MSQSIASPLRHSVHVHQSGGLRRPEQARPDTRRTKRQTYTIAHDGRQVRLGPVAFWIAVGTVVIMAVWSITTATYFAFHDDLVKRIIASERAQQYAYEDRIADLRAEIDRTTSRQLVDQEQIDEKLDQLARRQQTLESQASALSGVAEPTATGSLKPPARANQAAAPPPPMGDMLFSPHPLDRGRQSSVATELKYVADSLDRVEQKQMVALREMQARYEDRARQMRGALDGLGLKLNAMPAATGGPFVPVRLPPASEGFARAIMHVNIARAETEDLGNTLKYVPLRKPLGGSLEMTSPFGVRVDPFLHQPSMHTGIDLHASVGDPIYATAAGTVTRAGWDGGYGQMVEIDHGEGLSTRYGHMSEIVVTAGQRVRAGQIIGRVGSTGRSTGPHLHYETRVNGEAVNPERFLAAGERLFGGETIARAAQRDYQD